MKNVSENSSLLTLLDQDSTLESLNASILNDLDAFVFIVDADLLRPIWLNNFFFKRMGYTPQDLKELTSEEFLKIFHPKSLSYFKKRMASIDQPETLGQRSIYQIRTKNNEWMYLLLSSRVYQRKPDGSIKLLLGFATEIEKSELSRHLKRINEIDNKEPENSLLKKLTNREKSVIKLITVGMTDKEIAENLNISIYTTKTHRKRIISKLGVKNTAALVKFAVENDLD